MVSAFERDEGCCGAFQVLQEPMLLFNIFTFLDLHALFRLRSVCKSWYEAVLSPTFSRMYKPPSDPWSFHHVRTGIPRDRFEDELGTRATKSDDYYDYNMELESHVEVWIPSKRQVLYKWNHSLVPSGERASQFVGLAASNGLVCGRLMVHHSTLVLAVGNPFTNKWKVLPPIPGNGIFPRPPYVRLYMETCTASQSYVIVVIHDVGGTCVYEEEDGSVTVKDEGMHRHVVTQYESVKGEWITGPDFTVDVSMPGSVGGKLAFFDLPDHEAFAGYDPHSKTWSHVQVPEAAHHETATSSGGWEFTYKGRCLMASLISWERDTDQGTEYVEDEKGFGVWELEYDDNQECTARWCLKECVHGKDLFGERWQTTGHSEVDVKIQLAGDMLFFSTYYRRQTFGFWPPVAFDMVESKWHSSMMISQDQLKFSSLGKIKLFREGVELEIDGACCCPDFDTESCFAVVPSLLASP